MAKTSKRVGKLAAKQLRNPNTPKKYLPVDGTALRQVEKIRKSSAKPKSR